MLPFKTRALLGGDDPQERIQNLLMTPNNDDHHRGAVPTQKEKSMTPKIVLMDVGDTDGKVNATTTEATVRPAPPQGPS